MTRIPAKILSLRELARADDALLRSLGAHGPSLAFITCDQDDTLYAALDHATKMARVRVVYARSFYAGSAHASGPLSGEAMGVIEAADPDILREGLRHLRLALDELFAFYSVPNGTTYFPTVIPACGEYLAGEAKVAVGTPLGYFIAPPTEAMIALDAALKSADVTLVKFFGPPTETNFAGAYVTGTLPAVQAAATAFADAVHEVSLRPF
jgi:ethanolamine utilization protein EutL